MTPSSPPDAQRLKVLLDLNILDTPPEQRFDRITRLAARLFGVPVALVTLVDAERQWFKSRVGVPFAETPLAMSFCAHTIRQDDVMVVHDATADARFSSNELVTGEQHVRFYAGHPVAAGGVNIGTLCVVDSVVREFGDDERALLRDLAAVVANEVAAGALREAAERRRSSESALRALLAHLPDGVLLIDDAGFIVSANPAAEALFGLGATRLAGQSAASLTGIRFDLLAPATAAGITRRDGAIARTGGAAMPVEAAISSVQVEGRHHLLASLRDMTVHHAALASERAAQDSRRAFFRTATHELRTPMASILGFAELLLKREFDGPTGRELLGIIHKQSIRLVELINQILDLARIEGGGLDEQRRTSVDLARMVADVVAAGAPAARIQDIAVDTGKGAIALQANAARLKQALGQVLANALQFSAPGSRVDITMARAARAGRAGASVGVRDHGIGMTPEQQSRMFDAFYRAGEQPGHEGAGLGLTLVRDVLAAHGGSAEVASQRHAGTTVTLWLPLAQAGS